MLASSRPDRGGSVIACSQSERSPPTERSIRDRRPSLPAMLKERLLDCVCKSNSVVCHHRESIWVSGKVSGEKTRPIDSLSSTSRGRETYPSLILQVPPPRPEPSSHLAILRNPRHPEWNTNKQYYLSPALCNTSQMYIDRFIERDARIRVAEDREPIPGIGVAFSLDIVHEREFRMKAKQNAKHAQEVRRIETRIKEWRDTMETKPEELERKTQERIEHLRTEHNRSLRGNGHRDLGERLLGLMTGWDSLLSSSTASSFPTHSYTSSFSSTSYSSYSSSSTSSSSSSSSTSPSSFSNNSIIAISSSSVPIIRPPPPPIPKMSRRISSNSRVLRPLRIPDNGPL